jgi:hypothetical protein
MKSVSIFLLCWISFSVQANTNEDKFDLRPICNQLYKIATSALTNKEKGLSKADLLKPLPSLATLLVMPPSKEKVLAQKMYQIADEIFRYDNLEMRSYSAFTAESCHRQLKGFPVPESFDIAYPNLLKCNSLPTTQERIDCGMVVSGAKADVD